MCGFQSQHTLLHSQMLSLLWECLCPAFCPWQPFIMLMGLISWRFPPQRQVGFLSFFLFFIFFLFFSTMCAWFAGFLTWVWLFLSCFSSCWFVFASLVPRIGARRCFLFNFHCLGKISWYIGILLGFFLIQSFLGFLMNLICPLEWIICLYVAFGLYGNVHLLGAPIICFF